jgi:hypothetical protein
MGGLVAEGWTCGSGGSPASSVGVGTAAVGKARVGRGLIGKLHEASNPRMTIELTMWNNFTDSLGYREMGGRAIVLSGNVSLSHQSSVISFQLKPENGRLTILLN